MKKLLYWLCGTLLFIAVAVTAVALNSRGRIECNEINRETVIKSGPFVIEGGRIEKTEKGEQFKLEFPVDGELFLYFPRQKFIEISGCETREFTVSLGRLVCITPSGDGRAEITVSPEYEKPGGHDSYVYIGSFEQLNGFVNSSIICNYFVRGLCAMMILISVIMCAWKNSEKYFLWIALLAFFVSVYGRLRDILSLLNWNFLINGHVYWVLNELNVSVLMYFALKEFAPVKLGKVPYFVFSTAAALPALYFYRTEGPYIYSMLFFYAVLYMMYLVSIARLPEGCGAEKTALAAAWILTASLRFVEILCQTGLLPSGDINLRYRIRGIIAVIFVAALFICAVKRFAERFERSDRLNAELEKKIREKSLENISFIRSMLHNLKTPLFSVSGYTDLALETVESNPEAAKRFIEKANEKAIYAGHLMDTLSLAMRVGSGELKINPVPADLAEIAKRCAETGNPAAEGKNIMLSFGIKSPMPINGDPMYLQQALENIIDNAVINTPEGGNVEITAEKSPDAQQWLLHIRDNGCGIEESEREKIFEAYYSKRKQGSSSSGLGLYITREIIRLHGGSIAVDSSPGNGSDFIISMPAVNQASLSM